MRQLTDDLPCDPMDVEFKPHPDNCGAILFTNHFFFAAIGGEGCKCMKNTGHLIIMRAFSDKEVMPPVVYVDRLFDTMLEAECFAKEWLAAMHQELQHVEREFRKENTLPLPSPEQDALKEPTFQDRLHSSDTATKFLAAKMAKPKLPVLRDEEPEGFAYPIFVPHEKFEA